MNLVDLRKHRIKLQKLFLQILPPFKKNLDPFLLDIKVNFDQTLAKNETVKLLFSYIIYFRSLIWTTFCVN